jgi:hypothetical protein
VAVEVAEFTALGGLIDVEVFWPLSRSFTAAKRTKMFAAWIEQGTAKVEDFTTETQDAGVRAWVLYRAKDNIYERMRGNPASVSIDGKGSSGFTQGQIDAARDERDAALLAFEVIEAEQPDDEDAVVVPPRASASVPIRFVL